MPQSLQKCSTVHKAIVTLFTRIFLLVCICSAQSTSNETTCKRVLKATSIQIPPFLMVSGEGEKETMKGIVVDILGQMEKIMNVSFEIVLVKDGSWGHLNDEGNWTGMIGEVKSGFADIAAAPLTLSSERLSHVDMSYPFISFGLRIVIKRPEFIDHWNGIFLVLQPFTPFVWILISLACGVTGVTLSVIGRFSPFEWTNTAVVQVSREKRESFNWKNSFWYIITTFMWQGHRHFPRSYSGRILSIFWWIFALFTLLLYIGCIVTHLQLSPTHMTGLPFLSFDEMVNQKDVSYGTLKFSSTYRYFKNSNHIIGQLIYKNMVQSEDNMVSSLSEGFEKVRTSNGSYALIVEGSFAEYAASRYPCDLLTVGDDLFQRSYSFVTDKGSLLSQEINYALLKMKEMGVIENIHSKWKLGECARVISQETFIDDQVYYDKMRVTPNSVSSRISGVHLIAGPLILLLIGIVLSSVVLAAEVFFAKEETKRRSSSAEDGHQLRNSFEDGH